MEYNCNKFFVFKLNNLTIFFLNKQSVYLLKNSSFSGWASITNFEQRIFMPYLDNRLDLIELVKPTSESCSVVYRGKLYVYGQGSTNFC